MPRVEVKFDAKYKVYETVKAIYHNYVRKFEIQSVELHKIGKVYVVAYDLYNQDVADKMDEDEYHANNGALRVIEEVLDIYQDLKVGRLSNENYGKISELTLAARDKLLKVKEVPICPNCKTNDSVSETLPNHYYCSEIKCGTSFQVR
jgi:hypothetical protein